MKQTFFDTQLTKNETEEKILEDIIEEKPAWFKLAADTMRDWAARHTFNEMDLATELNNLWGRVNELSSRLITEKHTREQLVGEKLKDLSDKAAALTRSNEELSALVNGSLKESHEAGKVYAQHVESLQKANFAMNDELLKADRIMKQLLERKTEVAAIFGESFFE